MHLTSKIINDPIYGFITINHPLLFKIIAHPFYQRLRRIHQMALAYLVYPGAVHTRLHHSLGAYHLMCNALNELKQKGTDISEAEEVAAKAAILLHDVGHGPFSHALEFELLPNVHHEELSLLLMQQMNQEFGGELNLAIDIFTNAYPKKFLHQLVSGQLDVDRMDYLTRDSFFTGVSEGVIGYDRILKMLVVHHDELMVEEKGIYSIEKFLIARRQMYWQVYLHKTVMTGEKLLIHIIKRIKELHQQQVKNLETGGIIDYFLFEFDGKLTQDALHKFSKMDDVDVQFAIKKWSTHPDKVLQLLSSFILNRNLLKIQFQIEPFTTDFIKEKKQQAITNLNINAADVGYFVFTGEVANTLYKQHDEHIKILYKNGTIKDIGSVDNALINSSVSAAVKKFYICSLA